MKSTLLSADSNIQRPKDRSALVMPPNYEPSMAEDETEQTESCKAIDHLSNGSPRDGDTASLHRGPSLEVILKVRRKIAMALLRLTQRLDAHPILAFTLLAFIFVPATLSHSFDRALWHDELFTFYISQAPHLSDLLRDTQIIDLNPPLSYLLTRASFFVFGVNTLSSRLPEMLGFLLAMLSLFVFVRRRAGTLYGLLAATLLYTGAAGELAMQARPYGLLLGFGSLSLLGWQKAREQERSGIPFLLLGGFGMLLSHVFGLFLWAALAGGEAVRIAQRKKVDWPLAITWILPLVSLGLYVPLIRAHGASIFPPVFQASAASILEFYSSRTEQVAACMLVAGIAMLLLVGRSAFSGWRSWLLSTPEWTSIVFVLAIPLALLTLMIRSHAAWFPRYGTSGSLGISVLAAILLARTTGKDPRAAFACMYVALVLSGEPRLAVTSLTQGRLFHSTEPVYLPCEACERTAKLDASLPLVDASGLTFLEMDHRESSETLRRVYYLTDPAASTKYANASIFESMALEKSLFPIRANVSTFSAFTQDHHHFFVLGKYDYPEDWLLRKLQADGATLRMLGPTRGSYREGDLYEISLSN